MQEGRAHASENLAVSESPLEGVNVQTGELDPSTALKSRTQNCRESRDPP